MPSTEEVPSVQRPGVVDLTQVFLVKHHRNGSCVRAIGIDRPLARELSTSRQE